MENNEEALKVLEHIGVKRRSGRYKFGSGKRPFQHLGRQISNAKTVNKLSKMSPEDRKKELLKSTNPSVLYKYRGELSDKELQNRLDRLQKEKTLRSYVKDQKKNTQKKVDSFLDNALKYGNKAADFYKLSNSDMGKAIKATLEEAFNGSSSKKGNKKKKQTSKDKNK